MLHCGWVDYSFQIAAFLERIGYNGRKSDYYMIVTTIMAIMVSISKINEMSEAKDINGLKELLTDSDFDIRTAAIEALGMSGSPEAVNVLISLDKWDENTGMDLLEGRIQKNLPILVSSALADLGPIALNRLIELVSDEERNYGQITLIRALGDIGDDKASECLIDIIKDPYARPYHDTAILSLAKIGDERLVELINNVVTQQYLGRVDTFSLRQLIESIEIMNDKRNSDILIRILYQKNNRDHIPIPVKQAAKVLRKLEGDDVIESVLERCKILFSDNILNKQLIIMGNLGDVRASEFVQSYLNAHDQGVRSCATNAMEKLGELMSNLR